MKKPILFLALTQIVGVLCQTDYDLHWDSDGIVYLKPHLVKSLCVKTEKLDNQNLFLKLINCSS